MKTSMSEPVMTLDLTVEEVCEALIEYARRKGHAVPDKPSFKGWAYSTEASPGSAVAELSWIVR